MILSTSWASVKFCIFSVSFFRHRNEKKLSAGLFSSGCKIVHFLISWCQIVPFYYLGAKFSGCKIVLPLTNWLVNTNTGVFNLLPQIYGSRTRWWTHQGIGRYLESILTKKWHKRVHNDASCFVLLAHSPHLHESAMLLPSENDKR